jgi:hypothetical protein
LLLQILATFESPDWRSHRRNERERWIRAKRKASGVAHDVGGVTLSIAPNGLFTRTKVLVS